MHVSTLDSTRTGCPHNIVGLCEMDYGIPSSFLCSGQGSHGIEKGDAGNEKRKIISNTNHV